MRIRCYSIFSNLSLFLVEMAIARQAKWLSGEDLLFLANVRIRTGCGSLRGSLNLSMQIQVEYVRPGAGGNILSPRPTPPTTELSWDHYVKTQMTIVRDQRIKGEYLMVPWQYSKEQTFIIYLINNVSDIHMRPFGWGLAFIGNNGNQDTNHFGRQWKFWSDTASY